MKSVDLALVCSLDSIIRSGSTGTHEEVAKKLNISRSTFCDLVHYLINVMRAPILYNECAKSFFYEYMPKFFLSSEIKNGLLSGKDGLEKTYKNVNHDSADSDLDENEDEMMEEVELSETSGGLDNDVWYTDPFDDNSDHVELEHNINFNDLYFD